MVKCLGKDRNNDPCRNSQINESKFCKYHLYMNDYTEEMFNNLILCSSCKKMYYIIGGKVCNNCKNRAKKNKIKNNLTIIKCIKEDCIFKKSEENEYCGKHQKEYYKKQTELIGKKICKNYIRGCRIQLEKTDMFTRCLACRKKERVNNLLEEKENNDIKILLQNKSSNFTNNNNIVNTNIFDHTTSNFTNNNIIIVDDINDEINDNKTYKPIDNKTLNFTNNNEKVGKNIASINKLYLVPEYIIGTTKRVYDIIKWYDDMNKDFPFAETYMIYEFKINKIIKYINSTKKDDEYNLDNLFCCSNIKCKKLMPEHAFIDIYNRKVNQCIVCRKHAQMKSNRVNSINTKTAWKEENYDKVAKYWLDARDKQIKNKGVEKYLDDNAKMAKNWRDKNPEKQLEINENNKKNIKIHFGNYMRDANYKNINFKLSFEEFKDIVYSPCFYCGIIQEKGFNGIDKDDYRKGYVKENSLSCCEMCNFMKGTLSSDIFIKRIEHILTYQGYINGKLYPEYFANHRKVIYLEYKTRAEKIGKDFEISENEFYKLIKKSCYICGKKTDDKHTNGIDRINNDEGYTINNIQSCCGECNYMKNKFIFSDFLDKIRQIKKNKLPNYEIINSKLKCQDDLNHKKIYKKTTNYTEEEKNIIKEKNKIKMRLYRNKIKNNISINKENCNIQTHINKKSEEVKREENRLRKQKQREELKKKYGCEGYKKMRALEIANSRKKKKLIKEQLIKE